LIVCETVIENMDSKERNSQVFKIVWQISGKNNTQLNNRERFESTLEFCFYGENL